MCEIIVWLGVFQNVLWLLSKRPAAIWVWDQDTSSLCTREWSCGQRRLPESILTNWRIIFIVLDNGLCYLLLHSETKTITWIYVCNAFSITLLEKKVIKLYLKTKMLAICQQNQDVGGACTVGCSVAHCCGEILNDNLPWKVSDLLFHRTSGMKSVISKFGHQLKVLKYSVAKSCGHNT